MQTSQLGKSGKRKTLSIYAGSRGIHINRRFLYGKEKKIIQLQLNRQFFFSRLFSQFFFVLTVENFFID